jgi:hypothetical protein
MHDFAQAVKVSMLPDYLLGLVHHAGHKTKAGMGSFQFPRAACRPFHFPGTVICSVTVMWLLSNKCIIRLPQRAHFPVASIWSRVRIFRAISRRIRHTFQRQFVVPPPCTNLGSAVANIFSRASRPSLCHGHPLPRPFFPICRYGNHSCADFTDLTDITDYG